MNSKKHFGFSLMEILIAVFIVGILALATAPIISKQMEKADEYSYFLAYKTVEKMAGQIVALGDPEEAVNAASVTSLLLPDGTKVANSKSNNFLTYLNIKIKTNPINKFIASLSDKFAHTEKYILDKFTPKSIAATTSTVTVDETLGTWDTVLYDEIWLNYQVCKFGRNIRKGYTESTTTTVDENGNSIEKTETTDVYYDANSKEINCLGVTVEDDKNPKNYPIYSTLFESNSSLDKLCLDDEGFDKNIWEGLATKIGEDYSNDNPIPNAESFFDYVANTYCKNGTTTYFNGNNVTISKDFEVFDESEDETYDESTEESDDQSENLEQEEGLNYSDIPASVRQGYYNIRSSYTLTYTIPDESTFTPDRPEFGEDWCIENGYFNMINDAAPDNINCVCMDNLVQSMNNEKVCVQKCPETMLPYANMLNNTLVCCATDFDPNTGKCCPERSVYDPSKSDCVCANGYEKENGACVLKECPKGSYITTDGVCMVNPPIIKAKRFCEEIDKHWNTSERKCDTFGDNSGYHTYQSVFDAATGANGNYLSVEAKAGAFNSIEPNIVFTNGLKLWILGDKAASIPGLTYYDANVSSTQNMCKRVDLTSNTEVACKNAGGYFCKSENVCLAMDAQSTSKIGDARTCCSASDMTSLQEAAAATGGTVDWKTDARAYAVAGFTVFVDINGEKGDGTLWEDVYPFYIASNGTVYPAYPLDGAKSADSVSNMLYVGGNSAKQLPVDVYYYESTEDSRKRVVAYSSVSYARGICSSRNLSKYAPYCLNLGKKYMLGDEYIEGNNSICDRQNCFVSVRKKLKAF